MSSSDIPYTLAAGAGLVLAGSLLAAGLIVAVSPHSDPVARFDRVCTEGVELSKKLNDTFAKMTKIDGKPRVQLPIEDCAALVKAKKAALDAAKPQP